MPKEIRSIAISLQLSTATTLASPSLGSSVKLALPVLITVVNGLIYIAALLSDTKIKFFCKPSVDKKEMSKKLLEGH